MHRLVVEHHICVIVFPTDRHEPCQVLVGVGVLIHRLPRGAAVETKVRESVGGGLFVERIDRVDKTEFFADFLNDVHSPRTAKFDRLRGMRPNRLEETV